MVISIVNLLNVSVLKCKRKPFNLKVLSFKVLLPSCDKWRELHWSYHFLHCLTCNIQYFYLAQWYTGLARVVLFFFFYKILLSFKFLLLALWFELVFILLAINLEKPYFVFLRWHSNITPIHNTWSITSISHSYCWRRNEEKFPQIAYSSLAKTAVPGPYVAINCRSCCWHWVR